VPLIEVEGCVFDETQFGQSHGFETLDPVGREAFVNHMHLIGPDREAIANQIISSWKAEMKRGWPTCAFRIYRHVEPDEITIRFHLVRQDLPNWCEEDVEILTTRGTED
jgi:hypothetical protein